MESLAFCFVSLVSGYVLGAFLPSYFKKKGENLATKEDIAELTKTAKEIEAKIDEGVWGRQRQWELKREVVLGAASRLAEAYDSLTSFGSAVKVSQGEDAKEWEKPLSEVTTRWVSANATLDETLLVIQIVCEEKTINVCNAFRKIAVDFAKKIALGDFGGVDDSILLLNLSLSAARNALREELGISPLPTPESRESSESNS